MPQSPQFKAAGISILRYAYEACKEHGVEKDQLADLLTELRDAVLIGQHGKAIRPDVKYGGQHRIAPEVVTRILEEHAAGRSQGSIARTLMIDERTVKRYIALASDGNLHVAEPPPPVLPHSNGATARRADDQEPPKV